MSDFSIQSGEAEETGRNLARLHRLGDLPGDQADPRRQL